MSDEQVQVAPYKHSEWNVGELQTPMQVVISPATMAKIGRVSAESIEEQYPALRVCVVNVPMMQILVSATTKGGSE